MLTQNVVSRDFSCFGTFYHVWHLEALLRHDDGHFDLALKAFARALHFAKARLEDNLTRYRGSLSV